MLAESAHLAPTRSAVSRRDVGRKRTPRAYALGYPASRCWPKVHTLRLRARLSRAAMLAESAHLAPTRSAIPRRDVGRKCTPRAYALGCLAPRCWPKAHTSRLRARLSRVAMLAESAHLAPTRSAIPRRDVGLSSRACRGTATVVILRGDGPAQGHERSRGAARNVAPRSRAFLLSLERLRRFLCPQCRARDSRYCDVGSTRERVS
jgi:hypothetical protein